jgi:alkylation response protein AidB-like acyl-CoA dehydrogenase
MVTEKRAAGGMWLVGATAAPEVFTPERFSDEQVMIAKTVRTFLAQEIAPLDARLELKDLPLMREVVKKIADLGVFAADVPVEYGGLGLDRMTGLLLAETISRGSVSSSVGAHLTIGMLPIVFFGTDAQRRRYLPRMAAGEWIGAYALTEPTAGSDALSLRTTAVPDADGGYRLSGTKQFITNGGIAHVFVLYAKVEGKVTCFIVERDTPGFAVGPEEHKMGLRGSSTTSLFLDNARVPRENVLGEIGRGHVVALNILNVGRLKLGGGCVGSAKHALRDAVGYARERRQFGRPIASFGLIKQKIAEMAIRLYLAESAVYRAGGLLDQALAGIDVAADEGGHRIARALEEYAPECGINKVLGSETLDFVVDEMVQIYGGYGFIEDYPAARAYRDARINRLYEGTNEINRLVIAGQLLRRAGAGRIPLLDAAQRAATELSNATDGGRGPSRATRIGEEGDGILEDVLAGAKTVALACLGRAVERLGPRLDDHQEVLGWLSDQIIEVFAVESGVLRARQGAGSHRGGLMVGIARDATGELGPRIEQLAIRVLTAVEDGALLDRDLAGVHAMLHARPQNTMAARRAIADQVLDAGGYALGLPSG